MFSDPLSGLSMAERLRGKIAEIAPGIQQKLRSVPESLPKGDWNGSPAMIWLAQDQDLDDLGPQDQRFAVVLAKSSRSIYRPVEAKKATRLGALPT